MSALRRCKTATFSGKTIAAPKIFITFALILRW